MQKTIKYPTGLTLNADDKITDISSPSYKQITLKAQDVYIIIVYYYRMKHIMY